MMSEMHRLQRHRPTIRYLYMRSKADDVAIIYLAHGTETTK